METEFKSRVYADRPSYADFDAPAKIEAIKSIIARRLIEHPNAICSYSGGSNCATVGKITINYEKEQIS